MNSRSATATTLGPKSWAWYRRYGGAPSVPATVRRRNGRIVRRALLRGGAVSALAGAAVGGSLLLGALDAVEPRIAMVAGCAVLGALPAYLMNIASTAARARRRNIAATVRAAHADRIQGSPEAPDALAMAELLEMLLAIPGTNVFHRLRTPAGEDAVVDHAVARGNAVFLLEHQQPGTPSHLARAADEFRRALGPEVEVVPLLVVPGASGEPAWFSRDGVHLLPAGRAMERIGDTLADSFGEWQERPEVRHVLMAALV
jgi:hypothetical protein